MSNKKQILRAIVSLARKLGRAPSRAEFISRSGISAFFVLQWFRTWSDAVRAAGLRPYTLNKRVEDRALLEDWGKAVRKKRGILPRHIFRREGKYNPCTLAKRFGGWTRVPEAFRKFARGKREWKDVLAFLPAPVPQGRRGQPRKNLASATLAGKNRSLSITVNPQRCRPALQLCLTKGRHALRDRPIYATPIHFRGLRHEPMNEQGVVLLFGMLAKELGFFIEAMRTGFPDCEAMRQIGPERWQRVRIEFEYESRNFREHGHPSSGCDVIVCWRHNWDECPKHIEVVELSSAIKSVANSKD